MNELNVVLAALPNGCYIQMDPLEFVMAEQNGEVEGFGVEAAQARAFYGIKPDLYRDFEDGH